MADNLYYWENPAIIKENKEDAHVIALPYDSFEEALRRGESPCLLYTSDAADEL